MPTANTVARGATILSGILLGVYLLNLSVVAGFVPLAPEMALDGPQQFLLLLAMSGLFTANLMIRHMPSANAAQMTAE